MEIGEEVRVISQATHKTSYDPILDFVLSGMILLGLYIFDIGYKICCNKNDIFLCNCVYAHLLSWNGVTSKASCISTYGTERLSLWCFQKRIEGRKLKVKRNNKVQKQLLDQIGMVIW